ncbi:hypothetical protein EVAR_14449_1 [Eumeta japonica]|uniref:Uncharacterized protein n=1 Tax=Eumeta variegata TaxID=151549 RepID=A0A4C1U3T8_EUMVA|nr:hypothetical protein EVAR_14449_1 [Eumeta japonica]
MFKQLNVQSSVDTRPPPHSMAEAAITIRSTRHKAHILPATRRQHKYSRVRDSDLPRRHRAGGHHRPPSPVRRQPTAPVNVKTHCEQQSNLIKGQKLQNLQRPTTDVRAEGRERGRQRKGERQALVV